MSWQTYVDERLMAGIDGPHHHLTAAAILGHDGSVRAESLAFPKLEPEEIEEIMKEFDGPGHLDHTGLFIGGNKYLVIQGEPQVIRAAKGEGGVIIMKTGETLVFGFHDKTVAAGVCSTIVQGLGDHLIGQGL